MTRRAIELVLLCIAAPVIVLLFAMMAINQGLTLDLNTLGVPVGLFAVFIIAHIATRKLSPDADPAILPIAFALSGIGISFVTRIAPYSANTGIAINQVIWLFLGVVCMIAVLAISRNLDKIANYKYILMLLGFALLLSPLVPGLGQEIYGSRIWLHIAGFSFQPGEIAKIVIVLFLAGYLAQNREMLSVFTWRVGPFRLPDIRTLIPLLFMWIVALLIVVFEKDLGSAIVFFFVFLIMVYVASGRKFYLVGGLILIAAGCTAAYLLFDHVQTRVAIWLDPFSDAQDAGYQIVQSIYSIADGGLFGVGIGEGLAGGGNGIPQIPVAESDFIFSVIAEEIGLLGAAGVLLLFLCFAIRGFTTAARAKSDVSSFIAVGLTSIVVLQAFIIVGGVTRLIPLTGLTLPFVSQGGSSLLASFIIVGFLLRCGDEGTGVNAEMTSALASRHANSVLGRVALGKRLTHSIIICSAMFALLVANLTYVMIIQADSIQNMEGNNHTLAKESHIERGTISTYDGTVLAESVLADDGTYDRVYPAGTLASHIVGYYSQTYGTSGIESAYNDVLTGQRSFATWSDAIASLSGKGAPGNDVRLTINSQIQQAAQNALANEVGACVVMDPTTGAVLAMASSPTYDAGDVEDVIAASADGNNGSPLYNRAITAQYAPGSTFKIVSLATALENDVATEDTVYSAPGTMEIGNADVSNFNGNSYGDITLARAMELSANTVFGQLGVQIGADRLVAGAESFGFNKELDFDLPVSMSLMPDPDEMTEWETAWAAAGEPVGSHASPAGPQATVLEMAMVGAAIANDGEIMQPYLVDGIYNASGERSYTANPTSLGQAVSRDTADRVLEVMKGVVTNGTGTSAAISGIEVAGKTGTAERSYGNDIWFVGIADAGAESPSVVVAIVIEDGDEGEGAAKAQNVLRVALQVQGVL